MQVYFLMMTIYQNNLFDAGEKVDEKVWRLPFMKIMTN